MIRVTILSGPYAGRTRTMPAGVKPEALLGDLLEKGWEWQVDYSAATEIEAIKWFKHDLSCRVVRALKNGRPVRFLGKTYQVKNTKNKKELLHVVGAVEDAIVNSGHLVTLEHDGEHGVSIITGGYTH